ncbi:hypothetical protein [Vreelandella massiliensis]|uniref:hypothetical protein n=1 Tax=Vreelandella massiliensis TaxID=1816686 RepID=UPI00096A432B|nr:hypothetical protein [Halomonas massiliensis]
MNKTKHDITQRLTAEEVASLRKEMLLAERRMAEMFAMSPKVQKLKAELNRERKLSNLGQ